MGVQHRLYQKLLLYLAWWFSTGCAHKCWFTWHCGTALVFTTIVALSAWWYSTGCINNFYLTWHGGKHTKSLQMREYIWGPKSGPGAEILKIYM